MKEIYLDNCATTKPYNEVAFEITKILTENYGNPSSLHKKGFEAEKIVKDTRKNIAEKIGTEFKEIYFTSGGTESNNTALIGYCIANKRKGKHIITSKIEHPSILETFKYLEENNFDVTYIDVNEKGFVNVENLKNIIRDDTILVSLMYVNNEIGSIQKIKEIGNIIKTVNENTVFHVDGVQAFGKFRFDVKENNIDMFSASAHKIHGPKGIGFLYIKKGIIVKPIIYGGHQELSLRSGTENVPGIAGLNKATEITFNNLDNNFKYVSKLKEVFIKKLKDMDEEVIINSPNTEDYSPYILNISFNNIKSEVLLHALESKGIYVSTGSACSSNKPNLSYVLKAIGLDKSLIDGSIRISFSSFNTLEDIENSSQILVKTVNQLKKYIRR